MAGRRVRTPDPSAPHAVEAARRVRASRLRPAARDRESGTLVVGWFIRIVVFLALFGMLAFDGISVLQARARVSTVAADAADAAAGRFVETHSTSEALAVAMRQAASEGGVMDRSDMVVTSTAHQVTLTFTVHIVPGTSLLGHLPGTGGLTQISSVAVRTVKQ
jgi:hypothetical protein